jgi:hypothetical protein
MGFVTIFFFGFLGIICNLGFFLGFGGALDLVVVLEYMCYDT